MKKDVIAKSGVCPICGAEIQNYLDLQYYGDYVQNEWECECGARGYETYRLEFCGHWGVYDKDNNNVGDIDGLI